MTPLIDVMLVLLIIFIITIPSQTHAVKIDNPLPPPPNQPPPPPPEVINLGIDFDGTILWNSSPVDRKTLQGYIGEEAPSSRSQRCTSPSTSLPSTKSSRRRWRIFNIVA
jgi:biopolymer transport protein ExbD